MNKLSSVSVVLAALALVSALAACGGGDDGGKKKGSGKKGRDAVNNGQTTGGTAQSGAGSAQGAGQDFDGVPCDAEAEGIAWCASDTEVVFCSGGEWYILDCWDIGADYCAEDDFSVDCYLEDGEGDF